MNNNLDQQYTDLLQDILDNGTKKQTRNGDTISVFGRQIRHSMKDGFPLLTTKKIHFKSVVSELLWFLQGRTDLRWLLEQGNTIWVGDSYKRYIMLPKELSEVISDSETFNGRNFTKEEFINKIKTDDEFAKKWGELGPVYGKQWRSWGKDFKQVPNETGDKVYHITTTGIDQIQNLINDLKTNPDSRRMVVSAWNPAEVDDCVLPPCHYGFQVYTRELSLEERIKLCNIDIDMDIDEAIKRDDRDIIKKYLDYTNTPTRAISLMFNMRSNDVPLGLPFNLASYGLLLELFGKLVNMVPNELIANLGDAHIYLNQIEGVKEQLKRDPFDLPTLRINTEFWPTNSGECGVGELTDNIDFLIKEMQIHDFQIENYKSHPPIKIPLSN